MYLEMYSKCTLKCTPKCTLKYTPKCTPKMYLEIYEIPLKSCNPRARRDHMEWGGDWSDNKFFIGGLKLFWMVLVLMSWINVQIVKMRLCVVFEKIHVLYVCSYSRKKHLRVAKSGFWGEFFQVLWGNKVIFCFGDRKCCLLVGELIWEKVGESLPTRLHVPER